jgi:hypothetical protein
MPNVTIYVPADRMPPDEVLADLTEQCTELCTGILRAALANVHIIYISVRHGQGTRPSRKSNIALSPFERRRSWNGSWRG